MAKATGNGSTDRVVVVGLGRFGSSLGLELVRRGTEVLGIDSDQQRVQKYADRLTHAAVADTTDSEALRQLGLDDYQRAAVCIGSNLEASVLTTAVLVDLGIPNIWAKATSREQGRILERIGAHHVVLPEHEMGERVAHLVIGRMLDYIEFEDDYAIVKTRAPQETVGRTLGESRPRTKYGVTVVGVKRPGEDFTHATPETFVQAGDLLIVSGQTALVERFSNQP